MNIEPIKKSNKKRVVFLLLTVIMFLGISLAAVYFIYQYKDSRENKIKSGLISIDFTEGAGVINLSNTVPVIDEIGLNNTPYTFTIKNTSSVPINANIKLEINNTTNIDIEAVRYAFYIDDELIVKDNIKGDLILYTYENFEPNEEINGKLIFWIDYYYDKPNKTFSAKIKADGESIDIILPTMQTMCPGCVYMYTENEMYFADPDNNGYTMTTLTSNDYKTNYQDVINESGKNNFLGVILDNNNQIARAFSCGVYNNNPFCVEGTVDGSKFETNSDYLYGIYGEYNSITSQGCVDNGSNMICHGSIRAEADYHGNVGVGFEIDNSYCHVNFSGILVCNYDLGGES